MAKRKDDTVTLDYEEGATYKMPGRRPVNPKDKMGLAVRAMCTEDFKNAVEQAAKENDLEPSDWIRLAIARQLEHEGKLTPDLRQDATLTSLRTKGLV